MSSALPLAEFLVQAHTATSALAVRELALQALAQAIGFDSAACFPLDASLGGPAAMNKPRADDFHRHYFQNQARYAESLRKGRAAAGRLQGAYCDTEAYSARELDRLPFFNEIIRPQGITSRLVAHLGFQGQQATVIHLCRHGRSSGFDSDQRRAVVEWLPALGLAHAAHLGPPRSPPAQIDVSLTPREREIVEYVALGFRNEDIALVLQTSPNTVRNQLHRLFQKLGVANRAELAVWLAQRGAAR